MNEHSSVLYAVDGHVATITLNRPEKLNAFDSRQIADAHAMVAHANADPAVRVVILTGAGRSFSAGADLTSSLPVSVREQLENEYKPLLLAIADSPKTFVSAVNGAAAGIGSSFAMVCDLTVMADNAYILQAFQAIGLLPDGGATWHLARQLGRKRAFELMVGGERLPAARCLELGLANRVVPADELLAATRAWAVQLAAKAPLAMAATKDALRFALEHDQPQTISHEADLQQQLLATRDAREGITAFIEKRPAVFRGE